MDQSEAAGKPAVRRTSCRDLLGEGRGRCFAFLAALFPLFFPFAAPANDFPDLPDGEKEVPAVFAASRYTQTISDTPASVTLITQDDIRHYGYRTVFEALRSRPGFYDASSQWPGLGLQGIALPGDFNSRVLFLVNGMPVYEPTYGTFFLEHLDIASINRIEIVRGPGSALYGSGAVQGIINLVTYNGHQRPGTSAAVEAASHEGRKAYVSYGASSPDGLDLFLSASTAATGGSNIYMREFDTPDFGNSQYHGVSAGNDAGETHRLFGRILNGNAWLQWMFIDGRKHDPLASYSTVFNTDRLLLRERLGAVEGGATFTLGDGAIATARAYLIDTTERGDYPYNNDVPQTAAAPTYINVSDLMSTQYGAEFRYDRSFEHHRLLAGVELKQVDAHHQVGDQPGMERSGVLTVDRRPAYGQYSLFAQDQFQLDGQNQFFLGARYDAYRSFSNAVQSRLSPRLAYVRQFPGQGTGKLAYGEAYRVPTIYESLYQDGIPQAESLWENPNLRPEVTRTAEAIWESPPAQDFSWNARAYLTRLTNYPILNSVPVLNGNACLFQCNQYQNSDQTAQVTGVEGSLKWRGGNGLEGYASATLQRGVRTSDNAELPSTPRLLMKAGIHGPLGGYWKGALEASFTGRVEGRLELDGTRSTPAPGYLLVHAHLYTDKLGDGWRASLRVNNLFDRRFYTIASPELPPLNLVPGAGRILSFQLSKNF